MNPLIQSWLVQSAVIFLMLGSVAGMAVGALLLFRCERLRSISAVLGRWISTRNMDRTLEKRISLDPWFYRHSKVTGVLLLMGALFILSYFVFQLDRTQTLVGLMRRMNWPATQAEILLDALVLLSLLGALAAAVFALFILFRPSLLRDFEQGANRWVSLRQALKPMEIPRAGVDDYIFRHAALAGALLLLGSLYLLAMLLSWIGH